MPQLPADGDGIRSRGSGLLPTMRRRRGSSPCDIRPSAGCARCARCSRSGAGLGGGCSFCRSSCNIFRTSALDLGVIRGSAGAEEPGMCEACEACEAAVPAAVPAVPDTLDPSLLQTQRQVSAMRLRSNPNETACRQLPPGAIRCHPGACSDGIAQIGTTTGAGKRVAS